MSTLELVIGASSVIASLIGGAWALVRIVVGQFEKQLDDRFVAAEKSREDGRKQWHDHFRQLESQQRATDKTLTDLLIALPKEYVRREDHIRFETVINAKLDALGSKIELMAERQLNKG